MPLAEISPFVLMMGIGPGPTRKKQKKWKGEKPRSAVGISDDGGANSRVVARVAEC